MSLEFNLIIVFVLNAFVGGELAEINIQTTEVK